MTNKTTEPKSPQRRKFLIGLIAFMGGLISLVLGGSGLFYFLSPAWGRKKEGWLAVGPVANLKPGDPQKVDYVDRKEDGWEVIESSSSVWVVNQGSDWVVYDPHCTHLGCPVRWRPEAKLFMCPCHGGVYYQDGSVAAGPPPHPLPRYPVRVKDGQVEILAGV